MTSHSLNRIRTTHSETYMNMHYGGKAQRTIFVWNSHLHNHECTDGLSFFLSNTHTKSIFCFIFPKRRNYVGMFFLGGRGILIKPETLVRLINSVVSSESLETGSTVNNVCSNRIEERNIMLCCKGRNCEYFLIPSRYLLLWLFFLDNTQT